MFGFARTLLLRLRRDDRGATALELALVLPVFVVLVFGIFQFGHAQHKLSSIRYAMAMASRAHMLNPDLTEAQLQTLVRNRLKNTADDNVTVTMTMIQNTAAGRVARMTGVYTSHVGVPMLPTYPLSFQTTMDTALPPA